MKIIKIDYVQIETYKSLVAKERVSLENPKEAVWFAAYIEEELVGFNCVVIKKQNARLKSDYVFKEFRNKGIYNLMFQYRIDYCIQERVKKMTAFCSPMSLGTFLRYGFSPKSKTKYGIIYVEREL